jgi:hypothetical protein
MEGIWQRAVTSASKAGQAGKKVSPWDVITMMVQFAGNGGSGSSAAGHPASTTNASVTLPNPSDAKNLITNIFQQGIGRTPTPGELNKYTALLSGVARNNPTVTTTQYGYDGSGSPVTTGTTVSGGYNQDQTIADKLQGSKEFGAYQAATNVLQRIAPGVLFACRNLPGAVSDSALHRD